MTNAEKYKEELIDSFITEGSCGLKNIYDLKTETDNTEFFCNNYDCKTRTVSLLIIGVFFLNWKEMANVDFKPLTEARIISLP